MDNKKNIEDLQKFYREFIKERDWEKYHNPKDLSMAISIEVGELQEFFLWKSDKEIQNMLSDPQKKEQIKDELADVFAYVIRLADVLNINLINAFYDKMEKNKKRYPVDKIKGNFKKYNELDGYNVNL